mmetsp:Transcript_13881/g.32389  ORF Transcript_13881/g.32389 Transcript_13881/m.32389 type:complete len:119 (+) Transcript_13881:1-357(+)
MSYPVTSYPATSCPDTSAPKRPVARDPVTSVTALSGVTALRKAEGTKGYYLTSTSIEIDTSNLMKGMYACYSSKLYDLASISVNPNAVLRQSIETADRSGTIHYREQHRNCKGKVRLA